MFLTAQDDSFATQKQAREELLKIRETQKGKQFEKLTLGDKTFTAAKILEITDLGVKISHSSGIGVINWGLIQVEARTALGFDALAFAEFDAAQKEKELYPDGGWSTLDNTIVDFPVGVDLPTEQQMEDTLAVILDEKSAATTRATTRTALRVQWDALPAWINGPYRTAFDSVNNLLDEGSDETAAELIDACEPTFKMIRMKTTFLSPIQNSEG